MFNCPLFSTYAKPDHCRNYTYISTSDIYHLPVGILSQFFFYQITISQAFQRKPTNLLLNTFYPADAIYFLCQTYSLTLPPSWMTFLLAGAKQWSQDKIKRNYNCDYCLILLPQNQHSHFSYMYYKAVATGLVLYRNRWKKKHFWCTYYLFTIFLFYFVSFLSLIDW